MPWFLGWFRRFSAPKDLPMSARVATLEVDMLSLRADVEKLHAITHRVQGKVYKSISDGDIKDESKGPLEVKPDETNGGLDIMSPGKADLYRRAAQLRGR